MRNNKGFTLTEVMVVVAIIAIMIAVAVPNLLTWLQNNRLKSAARDVLSNMQLAKLTAAKRNATCSITFFAASATLCRVYVDDNENLEFDGGEEELRVLQWADYPDVSYDTASDPDPPPNDDGLTFTANGAGDPSIAFRPNGLSRELGWGFTDGDGLGFNTQSVYLKNTNNRTMQVSVSSTGHVKIE